MSLPDANPHSRSTRPVIALLLLLLVAAGGAVYWSWPARAPLAEPTPAAVAQVARPETPPGPTFDVVRIGPQGRAVIAGRAQSGAEVTVRDGDRTLGRTKADAQGQFVLIPDAALSPGGRELSLSARGPDGVERAGRDTVFLVVPATADPAPPVAVLLPPGNAVPRVLDAPAARNRKLGLDTVDYDESGEIRFAGSAKPDTPIRLYVDNHPVGDAKTDAGGQWTLRPATPVLPGLHQLRVDQLGPDGRVLGRIELPFQRSAAAPDALAQGRAIVQPGQNLWRIARQSYGQGTRYTVIYLANREQIRDPNRIYPGQVFAVPPRSGPI